MVVAARWLWPSRERKRERRLKKAVTLAFYIDQLAKLGAIGAKYKWWCVHIKLGQLEPSTSGGAFLLAETILN